MIFNLAKKKKVPARFKDQALYHEKMRQEDPRGEQAAQHLAFVMIRHNVESVKDAMIIQDKDYWEYVEQYDKDYFEHVLKAAPGIKTELVETFKEDPSSLPLPPKEEGGGGGGPPGGGMPPPAASSRTRIVTAIVLPGGAIASNVGGDWTVGDERGTRFASAKERAVLGSLRKE